MCKFTLIALKDVWPSHVRIENNPAYNVFSQSGGKGVLFINNVRV